MSEGRLRDAALWWRQVRYQNRTFWRSPPSAFFTIAFPLMFLVIFVLVFGNDEIDERGGINLAQYFTPALAVFAAVSASYTNLAINTGLARDQGILKRIRGTPLPPWIYMAGRVGSAIYIAFVASLLMIVVGVLFYDVSVVWERTPAALLTFVVGVACWSALGLAITGLVQNADSLPAVTNATLLPLAFFSGIFFGPVENSPDIIQTIAEYLPLNPFVEGVAVAFNPFDAGSGFRLQTLVLVVWFVIGAVVALRYFTWEPRGERRARRRRNKDVEAAV